MWLKMQSEVDYFADVAEGDDTGDVDYFGGDAATLTD